MILTSFFLRASTVFVRSTWLRTIYNYELIKASNFKAKVLLAKVAHGIEIRIN